MSLNVIELNDTGLRVTRDGVVVCVSPGVALVDRRTAQLAGAGELAIVGVQLLVEGEEAAQARTLLREAQKDKILYGDEQDGHIVGETVA